MDKPEARLTVEERARITEIQDLLIDGFAAHRQAVEDGRDDSARSIQAEIARLFQEKEEIEKWAVAG